MHRQTYRSLVLVLLGLLTVATTACHAKTQLVDVVDGKFKVGQRWNYWARPGEEASTFIVEKIEQHPTMGVIVHVGVDNVTLKAGKTVQGVLTHIPMTRDALAKSAAKVSDEAAPMPPFQPAYEAWKKQVDSTGSAPVVTLALAEYLNSLETVQ